MASTGNDRFIYDEASSMLFVPDGEPLKQVFSSCARHWNQLLVSEPVSPAGTCEHCGRELIDLDEEAPHTAISRLRGLGENFCVRARPESDRVIILRDANAPRPANACEIDVLTDLRLIRTVRNIRDINRAAGMGYWPDVRLVRYDAESIRSKFSIGQHEENGRIQTSIDFNQSFRDAMNPPMGDSDPAMLEVIPFTYFYPRYQALPVAAYLIPPDLKDGTEVMVSDPIEDIAAIRTTRDDAPPLMKIRGVVRDRRVHLIDTD